MSVCVRFEVSAADGLSLASARAALYGWLFARHEGGRFFVEPAGDRVSPALAAVYDGLRLLGLDWDQAVEACPPEITHVFCAAPARVSPRHVYLTPMVGPEAGTPVRKWIDQGYSGLALANCLARLGWSPRGKRALLTLDELAALFELVRMSHRAVAFERRDLDWFNRRWLGGLEAEAVTVLLIPHWQAAYGRAERAAGTALSPERWQETLALGIRDELDRPDQAVDKARFAFSDELVLDAASQRALNQVYADQILDVFARELGAVEPFEFGPLDAFCCELRLRFKQVLGIRSRDVMYVLRAALAGRQEGPCLVVICQLLGPARCVQRAQTAIRTTTAQRREA